MKRNKFWKAYVLLLIAQLIISNYFRFTPFVMLSILPVMILCVPVRVNRFVLLLLAFASGLLIDWLSEGLLGLNALALVPVAYARNSVLRVVFGNELIARKEDFTVNSNGMASVTMAIVMVQALFLIIYIWVDSAGTRTFLFNFDRFMASLVVGVLVSLLTLNVLATETQR